MWIFNMFIVIPQLLPQAVLIHPILVSAVIDRLLVAHLKRSVPASLLPPK
jgi:hypothetical protein